MTGSRELFATGACNRACEFRALSYIRSILPFSGYFSQSNINSKVINGKVFLSSNKMLWIYEDNPIRILVKNNFARYCDVELHECNNLPLSSSIYTFQMNGILLKRVRLLLEQ